GAAAFLVDDVEALDHAEVVAKLRVSAGPPALVEIADECGTAYRREHDVLAADYDVFRRITRAQREFVGRGRELLEHERAIEAHHARGVVHVGPGAAQPLAAVVLQETETLGLQDRERGIEDRLDLVRGEYLDRRVRVAHELPWKLLHGGHAAPL